AGRDRARGAVVYGASVADGAAGAADHQAHALESLTGEIRHLLAAAPSVPPGHSDDGPGATHVVTEAAQSLAVVVVDVENAVADQDIEPLAGGPIEARHELPRRIGADAEAADVRAQREGPAPGERHREPPADVWVHPA